MRTIAQRELESAKSTLSLLKQDHSLAFSGIYKTGITEEMLRYKIRHTEHLLEQELQTTLYCELFSFNLRPRWLKEENDKN